MVIISNLFSKRNILILKLKDSTSIRIYLLHILTAVILSNHGDILAGVKLLGNITVGYLAKIGGNAVVTKNISERATAVGIPARIGINND
jgi:acetyltransferase-like isoleucine patch superfamily enzyme